MITDPIQLYIKSSISVHFESLENLYIEHDLRNADEPLDRYELRLDGPKIWEQTKNYYKITIAVNLLVQTKRDPSDIYKHTRRKDLALTYFPSCLRICDLEGDYVFNMTRFEENRMPTIVNEFGLIEPTLPLMQATIESQYYTYMKV